VSGKNASAARWTQSRLSQIGPDGITARSSTDLPGVHLARCSTIFAMAAARLRTLRWSIAGENSTEIASGQGKNARAFPVPVARQENKKKEMAFFVQPEIRPGC